MPEFDDDLLAALQAARPVPGVQPSASSPEAKAMLARVLRSRDAPVGRRYPVVLHWRSRRLALAGLPVVAGVAAAAVLTISVVGSGPAPAPAAATRVRAAVLDALMRTRGDIVYLTTRMTEVVGPTVSQQSWTYPAWPAPGARVRFRLFERDNAVPFDDTESIYVAAPDSRRLVRPASGDHIVAEIIDVEYDRRTWWRGLSPSALVASSLSPALIRQQVASRGFTLVGTVRLAGQRLIELKWSMGLGSDELLTTRLWVDARTYLPLRFVRTDWLLPTRYPRMFNGKRIAPGQRVVLSTETGQYRMLPATPANLALLSPPIPAGFTRAARSPYFAPYKRGHAARKS